MKKLLSMLLVLTMVISTLMGVMVIDVNAMKVTGNGGEDINTRTWNIDMDVKGSQRTTMATGKWTVEPRLAAEGETVPYDLGEITQVSNLGKTYWHMDFDVAYKEADDTNATSAAYARFRTDSTNPEAGATTSNGCQTEIKLTTAQLNGAVGGTTAEDSTITRGGVIRYTFYAYSQVNNTSTFTVQFANPGSALNSINMKSSDLYSANGIPHKVDVYVWSNSADQSVIGAKAKGSDNEGLYYNIVVDGVKSIGSNSFAESNQSLYNGTGFMVLPFLNFAPTGNTKYGATYKFSSDWYVSNDGAEYEFLTRENLDDESFVNITLKDTYTSKFADGAAITVANKSDNITGVVASVDKTLEAAVVKTWDSTKESASDRTANVYESLYNNPASIFTGEATNVKLVDKATGAEVAPADATGTMDDYMFMINGVYVKAVAIGDPIPYEKLTNKDPFSVKQADHNTVATRVKKETYETTPIAEGQPAYGGLRSGFLRFTNEPRGGFTISGGGVYYNQAGYYGLSVPGMIKYTDKPSISKGMTTLQFDMYVPEYTYASGECFKLAFSGFRNDASTSNKNTRTALPTVIFTTNGKGGTPAGSVDLVGNAWNTVAIQFDATNTPTSGNVDIYVYVNGEKQLTTKSTTGNYGATAEKYLSFLEYARFYMPSYLSMGIMNDAWYIGDYTPTVTDMSANIIDPANVSGVTIGVDNENDLIAYDNSDDADYAKLIAAMEAAGYSAVYEQIVDKAAVIAKYDEVDGADKYSSADRTHTGAILKRWLDSPYTDAYIVNNGDTNGDGKDDYTIIDAGILTAVDNGNGTATITTNDSFKDDNVYPGIVHTTDEIVELLAAEGKVGRTKVLVGFASVNEAGKLPRVYSLQTPGVEFYSLAYDIDTKTATLNYREFVSSANIPFVLIVAAYNGNGKLLALDISDAMAIDAANEEDGIKLKTFTADFGTLDLTTVKTYKVFAFENVTGARAIMPRAAIVNTAYVAPVE